MEHKPPSEHTAQNDSLCTESTAEEKILAYFRENPRGTVFDLSLLLGLSKRSTEHLVAALKKEGKLVRVGNPRVGTWEVV